MTADLDARDAANRARALDIAASFIVQAPAGAGKTELLTQRFLALLATVETPEQVVAITFTRKAAAEMRNRILQRLGKAGETEPPTLHERTSWRLARAAGARDAALGWGLVRNPERLRIFTIDALCASLVRQMPYMSRFGGMPRIADKPALHYEEAARRTIAAVEEWPAVARALACLDNDAGRLRRLLIAMLTFREQWLPHVHDLRGGADATARQRLGEVLTANLQRLVRRDLAGAAERLRGLQTAEVLAAARHVAAAVGRDKPAFAALADWRMPLGATAADVPCWHALAALLLTAEETPRKTFNATLGLPAGEPSLKPQREALQAAAATLAADADALAALRAVSRCPVPVYATADLAAIETFAEVLVLAVGFLWGVFQEAGETDFAAVAERAGVALDDGEAPTELALRLDYAIRHLLVDEFQDTNPQQIELLEKLTAGWQADDGRTLFVVGDPMQSIYRFRKADVGLFLRAWNEGIGTVALEPLILYRNNRSRPAIVDWVNLTFRAVFPVAADAELGRVAYAPAIATQAGAGNVQVHPVLVPREGDAGEAAGEQQEAQAMLAIIDATWHEAPQADIAVLVRARNHLAALVAALRRERPDLRYEAVEIESLAAQQPIADLLALTHALCHGGDRVNWLAILRAPWCGMTLADLHALARPKVDGHGTVLPTVWSLVCDATLVATLAADGRARLAHLRHALAPLLAAPGRHTVRRMVEIAWRRLGGPACLVDDGERTDVAAYFTLLDKLEGQGRFDPDRLDAEVASLYAAPSSDPQAGRLRLMTIHKAKGLEFDTVILPGLHRRGGRNEARLLAWDSARDSHGGHHLVVAPYRQDGDADDAAEAATGGERDPIRRYIDALEESRADQETRRVLYVAATRAVRNLHLLAVQRVGQERKTGRRTINAPAKLAGTPFNILWPVLAEDFQMAVDRLETAEEGGFNVANAGFAQFVPQLQRLPLAALPAMTPAPAPVAPVGDELPGAVSAYPLFSQLAAHVGTLVHRYLELIATTGLASWDRARIAACQSVCAKWLRQQGHDETTSRQAATRVLRAVTTALGSERGCWILQARSGAVCELALTHHEEGVLQNHVIDRSFVEDGVRWIIDYKTVAHEGGNVEDFIAARREAYAPQLARYAALFADEGLPVRQALYFVDLDRFEMLS